MTETYISITAAEAEYLHSEITRLTGALAAARLQSANRLAAIRAARDRCCRPSGPVLPGRTAGRVHPWTRSAMAASRRQFPA